MALCVRLPVRQFACTACGQLDLFHSTSYIAYDVSRRLSICRLRPDADAAALMESVISIGHARAAMVPVSPRTFLKNQSKVTTCEPKVA